MNVTAIVSSASERAFNAVDALATALGNALSIEIPVVEGALADAPTTGYLLVFRLRGTGRASWRSTSIAARS